MARMIRKQIYLNRRQSERLKRQAKETGESEAELIRQAIDRQVAAYVRPDVGHWKKERAFIQSLIAQGPIRGGRTWTREDLYDRR
jgi:hypothetical protein